MKDNKAKLQALWAKLLQGFSKKILLEEEDTEKLYLIIKYVPELRRQALKVFFCPVLESFSTAMLSEQVEGLDEAFELMNERGAPKHLLIRLMEEVPEIRQEIWKYMLRHISPYGNDYDLEKVASKFPEFREEAYACLLKLEYVKAEYVGGLMRFPELREQGWKWIAEAEKDYSRSIALKAVMKTVPELKQEAWDKLVAYGMSNNTLANVMADFPEFRARAWELLVRQKPESSDLLLIIQLVPEFRSRAEALLIKADPTIRKMVEMM